VQKGDENRSRLLFVLDQEEGKRRGKELFSISSVTRRGGRRGGRPLRKGPTLGYIETVVYFTGSCGSGTERTCGKSDLILVGHMARKNNVSQRGDTVLPAKKEKALPIIYTRKT